MRSWKIAAILVLFLAQPAHAQFGGGVTVTGAVTTNDLAAFQSAWVIKDSGVAIGTSGGITSGVYLGTSASATNPQRRDDATTGLYSPAAGVVDVSSQGNPIIWFPTNDTDFLGTIGIGSSTFSLLGATSVTSLDSTAIGYHALKSVTAGSVAQSTAIGFNACAGLTTGQNCTAVGVSACGSVSTGLFNVCMGHGSGGQFNGSYNTLIGEGAGARMQDPSSENTVVGSASFEQSGGGSANIFQNTILGANTWTYSIATGGKNVFIGADIGSNILHTCTNCIIIGQGMDTPIAAETNYLNIGSTIYGLNIGTTGSIIGLGSSNPAGSSTSVISNGRFIVVGQGAGDPGNDGSPAGVAIAYDTNNNRGDIEAVQAGIASHVLTINGQNGGQVAVDTVTPTTGANLTIGGTGAIAVPIGTTTQRPSPATNGLLRYNSTNSSLEAYANNVWGNLPVGGLSSCTTVAVTGATPQTATCESGFYLTGEICSAATLIATNATVTGGLVGSVACSAVSGNITATANCCH